MSTLGTASRGPCLRGSGTGFRSPTVSAITVTSWRGPSRAGTPRAGIGDRDDTELGTDTGPVPRKLQLRRATRSVPRASPTTGTDPAAARAVEDRSPECSRTGRSP